MAYLTQLLTKWFIVKQAQSCEVPLNQWSGLPSSRFQVLQGSSFYAVRLLSDGT